MTTRKAGHHRRNQGNPELLCPEAVRRPQPCATKHQRLTQLERRHPRFQPLPPAMPLHPDAVSRLKQASQFPPQHHGDRPQRQGELALPPALSQLPPWHPAARIAKLQGQSGQPVQLQHCALLADHPRCHPAAGGATATWAPLPPASCPTQTGLQSGGSHAPTLGGLALRRRRAGPLQEPSNWHPPQRARADHPKPPWCWRRRWFLGFPWPTGPR
mmetsp:Transcript_28732/g.65213  ORF Transcript_28732/g.65213 Transcript_28732/m.65213 type:complete len:215 (-) Transcript_28732:566-1210(-)